MKISVNRIETSDSTLVFTISVTDPHHSFFGEAEKKMMDLLEKCKQDLSSITTEESKVKGEILNKMHAAKEKTFMKVLENLKFSIENELRPKFKPICQEIYNWIYDHQIDSLKIWMCEFDPERTKFYFDNDVTAEKFKDYYAQESEHDEDD